MPLLKWKKNIWKNITELKKDNLKSWKEKWNMWKVRPMKQILAIALSTAKAPKKEYEDEDMETWTLKMAIMKKKKK